MALCGINSGIPRPCRVNTGGLRRVLIANYDDVTTITPEMGLTGDAGYVTDITMAPGTGFYEFIPTKMSSNLTTTITANSQNGTSGSEESIAMTFAKMDVDKRNVINDMLSADLIAIVQDYNNKYWLAGEFNGLEITEGSMSTGTASTDLNGFTITLKGTAQKLTRQIDTTQVTIDDLIVT